MPPHHSPPSSRKSPPTSRTTSTTSTTSTLTYDETSSLLPHEQPPQHHHLSPTTASTACTSLSQILALHPHQIAILEQARAAEEEAEESISEQDLEAHVLSRIDCIEIDLWHERIRDYEAAELGQIAAAELGLVGEGGEEGEEREGQEVVQVLGGEEQGERLSRVVTYVNDGFGDEGTGAGDVGIRKRMSSVSRFGSVSLSLNHFHPYFWVDVLGICFLAFLVIATLLCIGLQLKFDREGVCENGGGGHKAAFWVEVQMIVGLVTGLILQIPVHRAIVPFVLPFWVMGTFGIMAGFKWMAGCLDR
ncbi:hypothetical protein E4T39_02155 [Aureobasidium subglaciale]|nr:hypothetical protein E4T39_02155 [Aureobasidium subglaciale]